MVGSNAEKLWRSDRVCGELVECRKAVQIKAFPWGNFVENFLLHVEHSSKNPDRPMFLSPDVPRETTELTNVRLDRGLG